MKSESIGEFGVWQRKKVDVNLVSCKRFMLNFVNSFLLMILMWIWSFHYKLIAFCGLHYVMWVGFTKCVTQLMHDVIVTGADEDRVTGRAGCGQGGVWLSVLRSSYEIWLCLHMVSLVYVSKQSWIDQSLDILTLLECAFSNLQSLMVPKFAGNHTKKYD